MTTTELQRELADASNVIAALTAKLERAGETIKGLEATIGSLRHERDRERRAHAKAWDAMSARIARLEEAGDALERDKQTFKKILADHGVVGSMGFGSAVKWAQAKEAKP